MLQEVDLLILEKTGGKKNKQSKPKFEKKQTKTKLEKTKNTNKQKKTKQRKSTKTRQNPTQT